MDTASQTDPAAAGGMDRFTRNYLIALGAVVLLILGTWLASTIASWNPRVGEINDVLEADTQLASYEYPFRVVTLENGVARLSSPRSFEVPVIRFLGVLYPDLQGKPQDDPAVMAAQDELVGYQKHAAALVQAQPDVTSVRWVLDRDWYLKRGILLD